MKKVLLAAFAALCFSAALGFAESEQSDQQRQRVLNVTASRHVYDLNPATASFTSEAQLFTALYEGLFSYDPVNLGPVSGLCTSYKTSRDKKRWTFTLRTDAFFSDGSPINAMTVVDSWMRLLETSGAPFASLLDNVVGAQELRLGTGDREGVKIIAKDDCTLVVHLKEPMAHLPKILCHHAFSITSQKENVFSGAFVLEEQGEDFLSLKKNEKYWDAANVRLPGIRISLCDDYPENSYMYNNGEIDWIMGNADYSKIIRKSNLQMGTEFGTIYLFFKTKNSPWDKVEFRNALLEAVPYDRLREKYAVKAETFIYPLQGYPQVKGISDSDADDALELMNQARRNNGIPLDKKLPLVFATVEPDENMKGIFELLKEAWEPLGVSVIAQSSDWARYNSSIPYWNADLFFYSWIGDFADPLAFLELFRGGSSLNCVQYVNEEYDRLLLESSRLDLMEDQYKCLAQAEQILLDDCMIIPIAHPVSGHIINVEEIGGWKTNGLDIHPFKYIYFKEPEKTEIRNLVSF